MNSVIIAILIFLLICFIPILIYLVIYLILPDKDSYMNELYKQYGSLQRVKVMQTWYTDTIVPRDSMRYEFVVQFSRDDTILNYQIRTDHKYARKYLNTESFDVLILPDYFDWELMKIDYETLMDKYSTDRIKFNVNNNFVYPAMIFPERLEIYNRKEEKRQLRKMKRKQK